MIFRLSQKLATKIKAGRLDVRPVDENPFTDWSANLFGVGRTQYILLSNTKSLYSTVMYAKGINSPRQFTEAALDSIKQVLDANGFGSVCRRFITPSTESSQFAKALNRSVTGCMNELIVAATFCLGEVDVPLHDVSVELNDFLLSAIAPTKSAKYGKPREAFKALVEERG